MSTSLISPYAPSLVEEFEVHLLPPGSPSAVQAKDEEMVRLEDWRNVEDMLEKVLCQSEAFSEHKPFHSYSPDIVLRSVRSLVDWGDSPQLSDAIQKRLVSYTLMALGSIAASVGEIQANEESPSARANQAFTAVAAFRRSYIMKLQEITKVWTYYGYYCGAYSTGKDGHGGSTIQNLGEKCLKDALESVPELFDQALSGLFDAVRRDLNNFGQVDIEKGHTSDDEEEHYSSTTTDVTFLHDSIKQLVLLANTAHCYGTRIEPTVISMIREHYERRVEEHSASGTIPAKYFTWVEGAIQLEKERAAAYLQPETLPSLEKVVYTALLGDVAVNILRGNFRVMMEESAFQCLGKVSRIFQASFLSEEPKQMRSIFRQYLEEAGGEWMGQLGKLPPFAVTNGLIQLMRHSQAAIEQAFSGDKDYTLQLHEAFQVILDAKPQKLSEELTDYLDYVMRVPEGEPLQPSPASAHLVSLAERSGRTPTAAVDAIVDSQQLIQHIGHVFSYLPNKDVFEELYWRGFAARLLDPFQRTSVASEEAFIGILKGICGQSFVSKFEGMLKDVRHFQKNGDAFRTWVDGSGTPPASQLLSALRPHLSTKPTPEEEKAKLGGPPSSVVETPGAAAAVVVHPEDFKLLPRGVQTDIYFLTKGYWPHFAPLTPRLPSQWNHLCSMVERFYLQAFSSRVVTWRHDLSTAVLVGKFQSNTYELCGTLIQCIALMKLDDMTAGAEEASVSMEALCAELEVDLTSVEVMSSLRGLCSEEVGLLSVTRSASSPVNSTVGGALQLADHVGINNRFTCPTSQVQLSVRRPSQEKSDEKGEAGNLAAPERNYIVEISIVRHMKCHHTATHEALVAQVTNDARYAVTPGTIKKVLAKLITQGYLERMGTEGYRYLS